MKRLSLAFTCLVSLCTQAQDATAEGSIWVEGSQWDVFYTVDTDNPSAPEDSIRVTYCLRHADEGYMALEKTITRNHVQESTQLQGYIRNEYDTLIYVRPVLEDGSIGDECLLYDFRQPYEYGDTIRYGVMGGEVREVVIDWWNKDSLDYYMLNNGDQHCLPAYKGIVYRYGYIGGPMDLFLNEAAPGNARHPKPTNISHVIFSTKGGHKIMRRNAVEDQQDVIIQYDEMLTKGATWECLAVTTARPEDSHIYTIHMKGDTLIAGRQCKTLYSPEHHTELALFEEGRKLYVVKPNENPEVLLDFGLQEGDCLNEVMHVTSISTLESQGYNYRTITIDTGLDCQSYFAGDTTPWSYYLIEGIGVSKDQYLSEQLFANGKQTFSYLLRCWKNGVLVYQAPGYETIAGIKGIAPTNNPPVLYDLQGRRLKGISQKGIYIHEGKKIVSK
ncbi:MAG: hypothetical protein K5683_09585 [Prevotella sp.]|nr:hypothetical protein [Prevotella sp.]